MDHKGCTFITPRLHVPEINRDYTKIPPPSSSITEALLQHSEEIKEELHFFTLLICLRLLWKKALFFPLRAHPHTHAPAAHKPAFTVAVLIW